MTTYAVIRACVHDGGGVMALVVAFGSRPTPSGIAKYSQRVKQNDDKVEWMTIYIQSYRAKKFKRTLDHTDASAVDK